MKLGTIAIVAGLTMIMASIAWAEVPNMINNQGRLTTPAGVPLFNDPTNAADGQIDLVFGIYDAPTGGAAIWGQTNADVAVHNGLFSVLLGNLGPNVFPATGQVARWLELTVVTNGIASTLSPRKEIVSVAYALQAGNAATLDGFQASQFAVSSLTNEIIALQSSTNYLLNQTIILQGATNVLQAQASALQEATGALDTAVGNLNAATGALQIAVGNLQTATNVLNLKVADLQDATNTLNLATNALQAQLGVLSTSAVTKAQDPMIISNGTVYLHYDTNDFILKGQLAINPAQYLQAAQAEGQFVEITGDTMSGNLVMQAPAVIQGTAIIDSQEITDGTIVNADIADNAITSTKIDNGTIVSADIANDTIVDADISLTADIAGTKIRAATTDVRGTVELATGMDTAAGLVVQANDPRLGAGGGAETDPQVGAIANGYVPRWEATNLVTGAIFDNGNIGIGTTDPNYKLDVNGDANLSDSLSLTRMLTLRQSGTGNRECQITHDGTELKFRMGGAGGAVPINFSMFDNSALYIDGNRNVGVNRANPTARLHIRQEGENDRDHGLYIQRAGSDYGAVMYMDPNGVARIGTKSDVPPDYDRDHISLNPVNGNVGLGTTDPQARLDVRSAANYYLLALGLGPDSILRADTGSVIIGDNQTARTVIQPNSGNVGIGTGNPGAKLDVRGDVLIPGGQSLKSDGGYDGSLRLNAPGSVSVFIDNDNNAAGEAFRILNNSTYHGGGAEILFSVNEAGETFIKGPVSLAAPGGDIPMGSFTSR